VLAGTNRVDVLDAALLRPGRFDRQVMVDKPDIKGRAQILEVHLAPLAMGTGLAADFAKRIAALTPGFSGAELANVCNEAALIAARRNASTVDSSCFDAAIDRVLAGMEKKGLVIDPLERKVIAFHEAGHALTGWFLEHADPVMKVSIVPRGKAALGYSQSLPRDVSLHTEDQISDTMVMALGGRAAEEVIFSVVSSGAQNDLERVTKMAYGMITNYGMNAAVGPLSFASDDNTLYKPFSEKTARLIDSEASKLVERHYTRSLQMLTERKEQLIALATALLEKEVIGTEELISILGPRPYSKSVDYDAFINAAWNPTDAQRAAAAAAAAPAAPAGAPTPEAEVDAAGVTAAVREVRK
jgi:AFG3 family protein